MIRYLEPEEKLETRKLWQEAFPEDSESFDNYYYDEVVKNNRIIAKIEDGELLTMVHLNPYRIRVRNQIWDCDYIVGVATKADRRHEGHMRDALVFMLKDMMEQKVPFCFLMPADEKIYLPFDFTFIYDQPKWKLQEQADVQKVPFDENRTREVADWMGQWLENQYQVHSVRDEKLLERHIRELESEKGQLYLLENDDELVGIQSVWGSERQEQRELLCDPQYVEEAGESHPAIMARIVDLQEFVSVICLKEDCIQNSLTVKLRIYDEILDENEGTYLWHLNKESSYLEKLENEDTIEVPEFTIAEMTSWLFGYVKVHKAEWCQEIRVLEGVFLDEVV